MLSLVIQSCPTLCKPMDYSPPGSSVHGDSPDKKSGWGLPNPGIEPTSPALQVDSLPSEPTRKSKNTRVGSLSLLQGIFPTQRSNPGLPHCRQILYQLSHQGSPGILERVGYPFPVDLPAATRSPALQAISLPTELSGNSC